MRQIPRRLPYSKALSTTMLRAPSKAGKPVSVSMFSEWRSPWSTLFSPPAS